MIIELSFYQSRLYPLASQKIPVTIIDKKILNKHLPYRNADFSPPNSLSRKSIRYELEKIIND